MVTPAKKDVGDAVIRVVVRNALNVAGRGLNRSPSGPRESRSTSPIQRGEAITLKQLLKNRRFNSFSAADTAQSWSLITFLMTTRQKGLKAYVAKIRSKSDVVAVFRDAFGETPAETEAAWKLWALARY